MGAAQVVAGLLAVAGVVIWLRSRTTTTVSPYDRAVFEARYRARGLRLVAIRRIGTEWPSFPFQRRQPIRRYEIDVENAEGRVETRFRGISRGDLSGDFLWRFDHQGRRERLG
jgi:hypothetical protein